MNDKVIQLYPSPQQEIPLRGLYLSHDLRKLGQESGRPYVYANYVVSLDGRIAVPHPTRPGLVVPDQIANDRDWRLFQELAVQADIIITSGRYLRDYADGRAQEILSVYDDPKLADLKDWRVERGLSPWPDLAVISASLDFPIPAVLMTGERSVLVFSVHQADRDRIAELESGKVRVVLAGDESVDGARMLDELSELGYHLVYNATGPKVMHLLLISDVVNRLYLTFANRLLGGSPYSSIVEGSLFDPPKDLRLQTLYLDPEGLDGLGQLFASYALEK